jgi:hypothetical protein
MQKDVLPAAAITIAEPVVVSATISVTTPLSCGTGATQSATVTAVGRSRPYQYNFNNQGFTTSNTFVTNTAGPVSVIARDVNGCSFATAVGTTVVALNYRFNFVVTTAPTCPANTATVQVTATSGLSIDFDVISFNGTPTALYPTVTTAGSATPASFAGFLQAITCSK